MIEGTPKRMSDSADIREANRFRKLMGLYIPESGKMHCLNCNKVFVSDDKRKNRLCIECGRRSISNSLNLVGT